MRLGLAAAGRGLGALTLLLTLAACQVAPQSDTGAANPAEGFGRALEQRARAARALRELLDSLEAWLRDLAAVALGSPGSVLNTDRSDRLRSLAARATTDPAAPSRALEALDEIRLQARGNVNPQLLIAGLVSSLRAVLLPEPVGATR